MGMSGGSAQEDGLAVGDGAGQVSAAPQASAQWSAFHSMRRRISGFMLQQAGSADRKQEAGMCPNQHYL